ncbi:unnamed protein product [Fraxinus pennsylvanica]|uniref:Uncharacterized protein n=1 Tax=Fraxinus pennsylvanica TaxID=56036 RepID=A0AAD2DXV9_9LAMI|nr:unnamed protein product [Fraxinus pennsylvanica]
MGLECKSERNFRSYKLPLPMLRIPVIRSPEHSGTETPPLQTLASVPFKWEDEPGKPRSCSTLYSPSNPIDTVEPKFLELPPRLYMESTPKNSKTPSPTTVLDGPYVASRPKFSSFRFFRERRDSFDSTSSTSPERDELDTMVLDKKEHKGRGFFGTWGQKKGGKREVDESARVKKGNMRRNGSFSSVYQAKTHLLAAIYEGFKQVIPWKSRKPKKEGFNV